MPIEIYTDGSCNTKYKIGAWAAIILIEQEEIILKGIEHNTTHNRMELLSAVKAVQYIKENIRWRKKIIIYSDSQYLVRLAERKEKLIHKKYLTKSGDPVQNRDIVELLAKLIEELNIVFVKVKAHQKKSGSKNYNRNADIICRKMVREEVEKHAAFK